MRIALISDLHGNEPALRAVLDDVERVGVDRIVCLGDVATLGPRPEAVIEILSNLGCSCILGNHDAFMLDPELIRTYTEVPVVVDAVDWCRDRLSRDEIAFFETFLPSLELCAEDGTELFLYHGTPRSHMEDMLATTDPKTIDEMLDDRRATVMAGGHTHIQMLRQHRGMLLVNPGSVGLPFREHVYGQAPILMDHAEYATIHAANGSVSVELRRVPVEKAALRKALEGSDIPIRNDLLQQCA